MKQDLFQLSRTMAYALRHNPQDFGLTLDKDGWVSVQDLLTALRQQRSGWRSLREEDITAVINQSEKQRFEMRDGEIRAFYGHSVTQKIEHESAVPPDTLFHGTTQKAANTIRTEGLQPMKRQYVHLSVDIETARQVALRRTPHPVVLSIAALQAHQQGIVFYLGNDNVWLADHIPPAFIDFKR